MDTLTYFVLAPMVYLAVLVFVLGLSIRIVQLARRPAFVPTLRIYPAKPTGTPRWLLALRDAFTLPSTRKSNPVLWVFLMLFHAAFALLFLGHLELIKPMAFLQIYPHAIFLGKGAIGLALCVCLLFFLFRRFFAPARDLSVPEDYFLLILLFLTALFGSQMDWARNWYGYSVLDVDGYRAYLWSLVVLKPDVSAVTGSGHTFMLVLHVFFANLFLILFPCSKLIHFMTAVPLNLIRRG